MYFRQQNGQHIQTYFLHKFNESKTDWVISNRQAWEATTHSSMEFGFAQNII